MRLPTPFLNGPGQALGQTAASLLRRPPTGVVKPTAGQPLTANTRPRGKITPWLAGQRWRVKQKPAAGGPRPSAPYPRSWAAQSQRCRWRSPTGPMSPPLFPADPGVGADWGPPNPSRAPPVSARRVSRQPGGGVIKLRGCRGRRESARPGLGYSTIPCGSQHDQGPYLPGCCGPKRSSSLGAGAGRSAGADYRAARADAEGSRR